MEPVVLVDEVLTLSFKQVTTLSFDVFLLAGRLLAIASDYELQAIGEKTTVKFHLSLPKILCTYLAVEIQTNSLAQVY